MLGEAPIFLANYQLVYAARLDVNSSKIFQVYPDYFVVKTVDKNACLEIIYHVLKDGKLS